jgi:glycosyltransferase involved in cell wall biosynthesis
LRILFVYDCLYPHTIGGFERFYRDVAERLAGRHEITYLTRVQWDANKSPDTPAGVKLIALDCGRDLYTASGRRRILPPLRFGLGVFTYLLRNRHRYDIVQTCSFPYFPMISCAAVRALGGPSIVTDWIEVWSDSYWQRYLGPMGGRIGAGVQNFCIRLTRHAFTLSHLAANALRAHGYRNPIVVLKGLSTAEVMIASKSARDPMFIFAGRHIPEKHADKIPAAIAIARETIPQLRAQIFGDGPERAKIRGEIARLQLENIVEAPGFVPWPQLEAAMSRACGLLLPSEREGYGSVVIEAIARGTPAIVVRGPDNAATDLIVESVNGFIAPSVEPAVLAEQMVKLYIAGPELRARTHQWYLEHASELSIDASVKQIDEAYREIVNSSKV